MKSTDQVSPLTWSEFDPSDSSQWIQQATKELKGALTLDSLSWLSEEGILWAPVYHPDVKDNKKYTWIQIAQQARQWAQPKPLFRLSWHASIGQEIVEAVARGVQAIQLYMPDDLPEAHALQKSLLHFRWAEIPIFWMTTNPEALYTRIKSFHPYPLKGGIPGISTDNENETFCRGWYSGVSLASSGANAVHELSYILHSWKSQPGIATLEFSLQTNFFLDIAKGRALRYLANRLSQQEQLPMPYIMASFNPYYLTRQSSAMNQVRGTTAGLAALVAGVDGYWIPAWNEQTRMALNIPLLLEEEGYLEQVTDPGKGSYFIESITQALIEAVSNHLETVPEDASSDFWQILATEAHQTRIQRQPVLVGATHFRSPEGIASPSTILQWPPHFESRNLEAALVSDLPSL